MLKEQIREAKAPLKELISFGQKFGFELGEKAARAFLAAISIAEGQMDKGLTELKKVQSEFINAQGKCAELMIEQLLGKIYTQIVIGQTPSLSIIVKNINFLLKNVPFASKKGEYHLKRTIDMAKDIGAQGILGQAYLDLGLIHKVKKRNDKSHKYISKAICIFEQCGAKIFLQQAKDALENLGK